MLWVSVNATKDELKDAFRKVSCQAEANSLTLLIERVTNAAVLSLSDHKAVHHLDLKMHNQGKISGGSGNVVMNKLIDVYKTLAKERNGFF